MTDEEQKKSDPLPDGRRSHENVGEQISGSRRHALENIGGLRPLCSLDDVEFDVFTFLECLESIALQC